MAPRYKITLTEEERGQLEAMTRSGKAAAAKFVHARALLLCDAGPHGEPWKVADVAEALGVTTRTIEHSQATVRGGGLGGGFDAHLKTLACSAAPEGRVRWTVRLLAQKVVERRKRVNRINREGLNRVLARRAGRLSVGKKVRLTAAVPTEAVLDQMRASDPPP